MAIAIFFTFFRFTVRLYALRKLLSDDIAVAAALLILLSLAAMYRYAIPIMFELDKVAKGEEMLTPSFVARATVFLKLQFAIIVLFWTTIWIVKIAFLIFYRILFTGLPEHMLGWWFTAGFTAFAYLLCWAFQLASCVPIPHYFVLGKSSLKFEGSQLRSTGACETPRDIHYSNACLYVAAVADIVSDLISESSNVLYVRIDNQVVMALGLRLLRKLRISIQEKLALAAIFSVGLIKITFAIIRVVKIGASATHVNPIWLALWSMIEASVAVVVACLPSFRVLFAHGRRRSEVRRAVTLRKSPRRQLQSHSNEMSQALEDGEHLSSVPHPTANGVGLFWHDSQAEEEQVAPELPR